MPTLETTKAWTDLEFRAGLTDTELETLVHPAGDIEAELEQMLPTNTGPTTVCTDWSGQYPLCCC